MLRKNKSTLSFILIVGMLFGQNNFSDISVASAREMDQQMIKEEEILELRTENTKTFRTSQSGVYVQKVFSDQVHYQGEGGQFIILQPS
ncbi:hypothetical protein JCM10914A_30720 [Paenibacillus sp. JCM 10914]|uniref:hypothetical protein n=1 Tax=Paenibacillus sp. JCM 10914 TaxID=1236974 RepID=UPI00056861E7|nr:hypothetical protein [Paenibacillus sp. JCM 10914]